MRELNHGKKDLKGFKTRHDIKTSTITFKDPKLEKKRQEKLKETSKEQKIKETEDLSDNELNNKKQKKRSKLSEWEELQQEERFLKKFKSGKISKEQLNKLL